MGDEDLIKQLLLNLAVNACEAMAGRRTGQLTFRLATNTASEVVELYVRDTGAGMTEDDLKKIYQPFYSTKKEGTGLGLSVVHRIGSALRLNINVDSQPGEGTTFLVEFQQYHQTTSEGIPALTG